MADANTGTLPEDTQKNHPQLAHQGSAAVHAEDAAQRGQLSPVSKRPRRPKSRESMLSKLCPEDRGVFSVCGQCVREGMDTAALQKEIGVRQSAWKHVRGVCQAAAATALRDHVTKGIERAGERTLLMEGAVELWGPLGFIMIPPPKNADKTRFYFEFREELFAKLIPDDVSGDVSTSTRREEGKAAVKLQLSTMLEVKDVLADGFNLTYVDWKLSGKNPSRCRLLLVQSTNKQKLVPVMRSLPNAGVGASEAIVSFAQSLAVELTAIAARFEVVKNTAAIEDITPTNPSSKLQSEHKPDSPAPEADAVSTGSGPPAYIEHHCQCAELAAKFEELEDGLCKSATEKEKKIAKLEAAITSLQADHTKLRRKHETTTRRQAVLQAVGLFLILVVLALTIFVEREAYHERQQGFSLVRREIALEEHYRIQNHTAEIVARSIADMRLEENITTESTMRKNSDQRLRLQLEREENYRIRNDSMHVAIIAEETSQRVDNDTTIWTDLRLETSRRIGGDNASITMINTERIFREQNFTEEVRARRQGDLDLNRSLTTEITNRASSDRQIRIQIEAEGGNRFNNDSHLSFRLSAIQDDLARETTERIRADNSNRALINAEEQYRVQNDTEETWARLQADHDLTINITVEKNQRIQSDQNLEARVLTETANRILTNSQLATQIFGEETRRIGNETVIRETLFNETIRRIAGDNKTLVLLNEERSDRVGNDTAEMRARVLADQTLSQSLTVEANASLHRDQQLRAQADEDRIHWVRNISRLNGDLLREYLLRIGNDSAIRQDIAVEVSSRISGDTTSIELINLEQHFRQQNDTLEAQTRFQAVQNINHNIASEISLRTSRDAELRTAIETETYYRLGNESRLAAWIVLEEVLRIRNYTAIERDLAIERSLRIAGDNSNAAMINAEVALRIQNDTEAETARLNLTRGLENEISNRTLNDRHLLTRVESQGASQLGDQSRLNALEATVSLESIFRIGNDTLIRDDIGVETRARVHADEIQSRNLASEISQRTSRDQQFQVQLSTETSHRLSNQTVLRALLAAEETLRINNHTLLRDDLTRASTERVRADNSITALINAEEQFRIQNATAETWDRRRADQDLANNINAEANQRISHHRQLEAQLQTERAERILNIERITSRVSLEETLRVGNETEIRTALSTETAARIANDNTNRALISSETTARSTAISVLSARPYPVAGTIEQFVSRECPPGYVEVNGSVFRRVDFLDLFNTCAVCGPGDGSTTFTLPDWTTTSKFIRVSGPTVGVGVEQDDATAANNLRVAVSVGDHSHSTTIPSNSWTTHGGHPPYNQNLFNLPVRRAATVQSSRASISASATISSSDPETRPTSVALRTCIKV